MVATPLVLVGCGREPQQLQATSNEPQAAKMQRQAAPSADKLETFVPAAGSPAMSRDMVIRRLVSVGGRASPQDTILVSRELSSLPTPLLKRMLAKGLVIIACRGSVVDAMPELAPLAPRGWPAGSTFQSIPGTYSVETKRVLIAVSNGGTIPARGQGHDSYNLVLHELGHGLQRERVLDDVLSPEVLAAAFDRDFARLRELYFDVEMPGADYLQNSADPTREEVFAETFARFWGGDPRLRDELPEADAIWREVAAKLASMS